MERGTHSGNYTYQCELARNSLARGRQEGMLEGEKKGMLEAVFAVLEIRFGVVPERVKEAVRRDSGLFYVVLWHAINAETLELFEAELRARAAGAPSWPSRCPVPGAGGGTL